MMDIDLEMGMEMEREMIEEEEEERGRRRAGGGAIQSGWLGYCRSLFVPTPPHSTSTDTSPCAAAGGTSPLLVCVAVCWCVLQPVYWCWWGLVVVLHDSALLVIMGAQYLAHLISYLYTYLTTTTTAADADVSRFSLIFSRGEGGRGSWWCCLWSHNKSNCNNNSNSGQQQEQDQKEEEEEEGVLATTAQTKGKGITPTPPTTKTTSKTTTTSKGHGTTNTDSFTAIEGEEGRGSDISSWLGSCLWLRSSPSSSGRVNGNVAVAGDRNDESSVSTSRMMCGYGCYKVVVVASLFGVGMGLIVVTTLLYRHHVAL